MKHLKVFESFSAFDNAKTSYRWVGPAGLFMYFYGDISNNEMRQYLFNNKKPNLPLKLEMQTSHDLEEISSICMTIDPNYMGEPYSGDSIIRLNFNFEKMKQELDPNMFQDLTDNGEAEVRYTANIPNWIKYVNKIDLQREYFEKGFEDDFGKWSAIKNWYPKEFLNLVKIFNSEKELMSRDKTFDKNKLRR